MDDLVEFVIEKHGGIKLWEEAVRVSATVHVHGGFWAFKGQPDLLGVEKVTVDLRRPHIGMSPFGKDRSVSFDARADRVVISRADGSVAEELEAPRASMAGFTGETPWTAPQTGYFISYATRMYLLEPYLFTLPGITTREVEPWSEAGETWRRLEVTFPGSFPSHNSVQTYYFDAATGLQRRMDYSPDVNGNPLVAHYTNEHHDFGGLVVPTRRRVLLRREDNTAIHEAAAILLDLKDLRLEQ